MKVLSLMNVFMDDDVLYSRLLTYTITTLDSKNTTPAAGFRKISKRKQKSTEFVTGDKLNDASPDTLRILAVRSNGEFGLPEFKLENVSMIYD